MPDPSPFPSNAPNPNPQGNPAAKPSEPIPNKGGLGNQKKTTPCPRVIEKQVRDSLRFYKFAIFFWRILWYVLGIIAVIIAGLPAAREIWNDNDTMDQLGKFGAFASPIMVALIAFLKARPYSQTWVDAWRIVTYEWGRYNAGEIALNELWEAWLKAEKIEIEDE